MKRPLWIAILVVVAAAWAATAVLLLTRIRQLEARATRLQQLSEQAAQLTRHAQQLLAELERTPLSVGPPPAVGRMPAGTTPRNQVEAVRLLAQAQQKLSELEEKLDKLELENQSFRSRVDELASRSSELEASRQEIEERLASTLRVVEAMRSQLETSTQQVVRLEARNQLLGQENARLRNQLDRWQRASQELQSLYRRQEAVLSRLIRRYRDLADYFRTVGVEVQGGERGTATEQIDLSRIRNVLGLAEDDLQQLEAINSTLSRLQQSLLQNR